MPRPPFTFSRETERAAIDRRVHDPSKRQLLYDMLDVVIHARESGEISRADMAPIMAGFEMTDEGVWSTAAGWLAKLHAAFPPDVQPTIEELARHRNAVVRFNLCASLDRFPKEVAVPGLRRFLADKSAKVRGTVLNVAVKTGHRELIPDFEKLLEEEPTAKRQQDLRQAIALLKGESFIRDGWRIQKLGNGDIGYVPTDVNK